MNILTSPDPENPHATAGVSFMINKSLISTSKITAHELLPERALTIEIDWLEPETMQLRVINIYVVRTE